MEFPFQFELFEQKFYLHFIFETLAFIVGIRVYYFLRRKSSDSISDVNRLWILLGAMVGALLGSRIIASFEVTDIYSQFSWLKFYGNKTVLGGFLGGIICVELTKKIIRERQSSGDLYVIPILIALIIGRMGCFSMGIAEPTYGIETQFFTGMNLGDGKLRHPIMLYEMGFCFALLLLHPKIKKLNNLQNGDVFKLFILLYFSFRFCMEFLKPFYPVFLGLGIIHWCGIFIWVYYFPFLKRILNFKSLYIK